MKRGLLFWVSALLPSGSRKFNKNQVEKTDLNKEWRKSRGMLLAVLNIGIVTVTMSFKPKKSTVLEGHNKEENNQTRRKMTASMGRMVKVKSLKIVMHRSN